MSIYNAMFDPCSPRLSKEKICESDRTEPGMARSAGSGTCEDSSQSDRKTLPYGGWSHLVKFPQGITVLMEIL
jgi:hypothetical protein